MAIFSSFLTGRYLRISLLDSCHFQCEYCVDKNAQHSSLSASVALTLNELSLLIKSLVHLGLRKVLLAGCEPLLRGDVIALCRRIAHLPGLVELALLTNGQLLAEQAAALFTAGLSRIGVQLDNPAALAPKARLAIDAGFSAANAAGFRHTTLLSRLPAAAPSAQLESLLALALHHRLDLTLISEDVKALAKTLGNYPALATKGAQQWQLAGSADTQLQLLPAEAQTPAHLHLTAAGTLSFENKKTPFLDLKNTLAYSPGSLIKINSVIREFMGE
ncbi:radical SAM protein [Gallaecimonas pentaromativorans]|uniref:radical SAM protein n=1 Tax=Gallaecimonas pentaromativorans TaxID=584787 RepID=UPI003A944B6B